MPNFWKVVNDVIKEADILIEVLDSRMVEESRNEEIENKVRKAGKELIYCINKCDLVDKSKLEKYKRTLKPCVFMSAQKRMGMSYLRSEIMKRAPPGKFKVGVLGYPNTGKSSVINSFKGRNAASTAPMSGHTKGIQIIKVSQRMYLVDSPGVFPYKEKDEAKHAMIAARTFGDLKNPEDAACLLISEIPELIEKYYGIEHYEDPEEALEALAIKMNKLKKGGIGDVNASARKVLKDWQDGKIKMS